MFEFWLGVLVLPVSVLAIGIVWAALRLLRDLVRWANGKVHARMVSTVRLRQNLFDFGEFEDPGKERPRYWDAATRIRDALLKSPKLVRVEAFGWQLLFVRDFRTEPGEVTDD